MACVVASLEIHVVMDKGSGELDKSRDHAYLDKTQSDGALCQERSDCSEPDSSGHAAFLA